MDIKSIRHKGLKHFIERDDPKGLSAANINKIRDIVTALIVADNINEFPSLPGWRLHQLSGDRKGKWSITVTGNWRIVFEIRNNEIYELNFEDYH